MVGRNIRPRRRGQHAEGTVAYHTGDPERRCLNHGEQPSGLALLTGEGVGEFIEAVCRDGTAQAVGERPLVRSEIEHRPSLRGLPGPGRHPDCDAVFRARDHRSGVADADVVAGLDVRSALREFEQNPVLAEFLEGLPGQWTEPVGVAHGSVRLPQPPMASAVTAQRIIPTAIRRCCGRPSRRVPARLPAIRRR